MLVPREMGDYRIASILFSVKTPCFVDDVTDLIVITISVVEFV